MCENNGTSEDVNDTAGNHPPYAPAGKHRNVGIILGGVAFALALSLGPLIDKKPIEPLRWEPSDGYAHVLFLTLLLSAILSAPRPVTRRSYSFVLLMAALTGAYLAVFAWLFDDKTFGGAATGAVYGGYWAYYYNFASAFWRGVLGCLLTLFGYAFFVGLYIVCNCVISVSEQPYRFFWGIGFGSAIGVLGSYYFLWVWKISKPGGLVTTRPEQ